MATSPVHDAKDQAVKLKRPDGGAVFLATVSSHSKAPAEAAADLIRAVRPATVVLGMTPMAYKYLLSKEYAAARRFASNGDSALGLAIVACLGGLPTQLDVLEVLLQSLIRGIPAGTEFAAPYQASIEVGAQIVLAGVSQQLSTMAPSATQMAKETKDTAAAKLRFMRQLGCARPEDTQEMVDDLVVKASYEDVQGRDLAAARACVAAHDELQRAISMLSAVGAVRAAGGVLPAISGPTRTLAGSFAASGTKLKRRPPRDSELLYARALQLPMQDGGAVVGVFQSWEDVAGVAREWTAARSLAGDMRAARLTAQQTQPAAAPPPKELPTGVSVGFRDDGFLTSAALTVGTGALALRRPRLLSALVGASAAAAVCGAYYVRLQLKGIAALEEADRGLAAEAALSQPRQAETTGGLKQR